MLFLANIFQLTNKSCPEFDLPSIFSRQNCYDHIDCRWPRICCKFNGKKTCRFPLPSWRNNLLKTITKSESCLLVLHPFY